MSDHPQTVYPSLLQSDVLSPPTIVLLNGWGMSASAWDSLIPVLQAEYDVVVMNVAYNDDVNALCSFIHKQLPEQCILIGWSLGGMLATQIATAYPDSILGLITLASNAQFVADSESDSGWSTAMPADTFEAFFQSFIDNPEKALQRFSNLVVQGDQQRREQKRYLPSSNQTSNASELQAGLLLLREIHNHMALKKMRCPSLHLFGENDALVPVSAAHAIKQLNAQLNCETISDAGHLLHSPVERIETIVMPFLSTIVNRQHAPQDSA